MTGQSDDSNIEMAQNKVYGVPLKTSGTIPAGNWLSMETVKKKETMNAFSSLHHICVHITTID